MRMIPNDFWNKIKKIFHFWGIPETPKFDFFFKFIGVPQFSTFFDETGLKWKIIQFRTYWQREMSRFCLRGVPRTPNTKTVTLRSLFWNFRTLRGKNLDISLCQYVRNWNIFHLRPVPSKILRIAPSRTFWKKYFSKKKISGFRGFPENEKV